MLFGLKNATLEHVKYHCISARFLVSSGCAKNEVNRVFCGYCICYFEARHAGKKLFDTYFVAVLSLFGLKAIPVPVEVNTEKPAMKSNRNKAKSQLKMAPRTNASPIV